MNTARDLFVHELRDTLDAERRLVDVLGIQRDESSRPDVQKLFAAHRARAEKQVGRVERCFQEVGEPPSEIECRGIRGIIEEHEVFKLTEPSKDLLDIYNIGTAVKAERYVIGSYESLMRLAEGLRLRRVARLINQNLKEEKQALRKMEVIRRKLRPSELGVEVKARRRARRTARKT